MECKAVGNRKLFVLVLRVDDLLVGYKGTMRMSRFGVLVPLISLSILITSRAVIHIVEQALLGFEYSSL